MARFGRGFLPRSQPAPPRSALQTISGAGGIASAEAFGSHTLAPTITVSPSAIGSEEALGAITITQATSVAPAAIDSTEAFGEPSFSLGAVTISLAGIASTEALGAVTITIGSRLISVEGIASAEALGTVGVTVGPVTISLAGIASTEALGAVTIEIPALTISLAGIASVEALGTARTTHKHVLTGIASAEALGSTVVAPGPRTLAFTGIATAEAFGTPRTRYLVMPASIGSAEAFGTVTVYFIYRWRRLRAVQYHAIVYAPDSNGGPGLPKLELDPHILNLVWSQTQNLSGQAAFALARRNPVVDQISWMVDHIKIFRETAASTRVVFAGKLVQPVLSAIDVFGYCLDYAGFLQLSVTGYRTAYANKKIGTEVISPEWTLAKNLTNSPFAFVTTGTIENPRGQDGSTEISTNADFGVVLFDRLFTFNTLAEMSMANTSNNVKFEITRESPHTFNLWRNYGANKTTWAGVWPGNLASYDFDGGRDGIRHDLRTVISDGAGGQVEHSVQSSDANSTLLRRLQAAVAIRTLFGGTGTTESDQGKAALARQLVVSQRYPRLVRVTPRQGDFPVFDGNDLGDRFRLTIQKPDATGDFYDGYLLLQQVIGVWEPSTGGELVDLYLRGQT